MSRPVQATPLTLASVIKSLTVLKKVSVSMIENGVISNLMHR